MRREPAFFIGKPIFSLQTMLRQISFWDRRVLPVIPSGVYGRNTYASVRSLQAVCGLPQTGRVDPSTWNAVTAAYREALCASFPPQILPVWPVGRIVPPGAQDPDLCLVQAMLHVLAQRFSGVSAPELTGRLDTATTNGLMWIQAAAGLPQNGALDAQTWRALGDLYRNSTGAEEWERIHAPFHPKLPPLQP